MTMSQTLLDLKQAIAASETLGTVPAADQRIFYLGRELKSLNRSLSNLLGRQRVVNVIHFMAIQRNLLQQQQQEEEEDRDRNPTASLASDDDDDDIIVVENNGNKPIELIDLADDDSDNDIEEIQTQPTIKRRRRT
jgi:hypothetical protein